MKAKGGKCYAKGGKVKGEGLDAGDETKQDGEKAEWKEPEMKAHGGRAKARMHHHRPGRKHGGRIGADKSPMVSARKDMEEDGVKKKVK